MNNPRKRSGALGMNYGDTVLIKETGEMAVAGEFFQDGDVEINVLEK